MMENHELMNTRELFGFKRLCLVNSSSNAYSELPVQKHLVLNGRNNQGKTASLNVVKLALFPEFNFARCESKFGFQARNGDYYSKQDTFEHYFPTNQSYIVVEATNPEGDFCIVLYRTGSDFSYSRILVPRPLAEIRHFFWDISTGANEGMGSPTHINKSELLKELKAYDSIHVDDAATLCEYLYGGAHSLKQRRFCMIPLVDGGKKESVKCLRSLINLAFDLTASNDNTLPRVLAAVIEMKKDREQSKVKVKFQESIEEYKALSLRKDNLQRIRENKSLWEQAAASARNYQTNLLTSAQLYNAYQEFITLKIADMQPELEKLTQLETASTAEYQAFNAELKNKVSTFEQSKGAFSTKNTMYKRYSDDFNQLNLIKGQWGSSFDIEQEIIDCKAEIKDKNNQLNAITNLDLARNNLQSKITNKNNLLAQQEASTKQLENLALLLLNQVDQVSADILFNINPAFSEVYGEFNEAEIGAITNFTALFTQSTDNISLKGHPVNTQTKSVFSTKAAKVKLETKLAQLKKAIENTNDSIGDYQEIIKSITTKSSTAEATNVFKEDIAKAERDLDVLSRAKEVERLYNELNKEVPVMKSALLESEDDITKSKVIKRALLTAQEKAKEAKKNLLPQITELTKLAKKLSQEAIPYRKYFETIKQYSTFNDDLTQHLVDDLCKTINNLNSMQTNSFADLRLITGLGLIDEYKDIAHSVEISKGEFARAMTDFSELFSTVEQKQTLLNNEINAHNNKVSSEINEIKEGSRLIDTKVKEINNNFERCAISDLETVTMVVDKNPQFEELVRHLERNNPEFSQHLFDESFYERLNTFCLQHLTGKDQVTTIKMENLISNVRYEYKKIGSTKVNSKPQSGGTTATTNCILLAYLLNQIMAPATEVNIPIVMDEIGNLDSSNIPEVKKVADEYGFTLFAATPDLNPSVIDALNNYVTLGEYICESPVSEEASVICFDREEFFGAVIEEANVE